MTLIAHRKLALAALAALTLSACSTIQPQPLGEAALREQGAKDHAAAAADVEPLDTELTLDQAIARALKYNLDRRVKMMEEALTFRQLDVAHYDMLPRLLAQAGYSWRNNDRTSRSLNPDTGVVNEIGFISQDREHTLNSLGVSWNLLDLGVGYFNTRQQADRVLIATEKRRKAMHLLMQDVRTAFWRAASAQKLQADVRAATRTAEEALADSRKAEAERLRNPIDALRYQRQVLENLRLLEAIDQELSTARIELAALINAPLGQSLTLVEPPAMVDRQPLEIPAELMEEVAMTSNADVREQHYNARIAREETRKTLVRLFPNLSFNYGLSYDTDSYLVNNRWNEAGVQLSFNLFNLFTGPTQLRLADAGVALADQRRVAAQMAVLAQVHVGRLQLANALNQFERADAIWETDRRIAEHTRNREASQAQSKLDVVANQTTAILSLLRRYQALAQAQAAEARLQATLGIEPGIGSVGEIPLADLTRDVSQSRNVWAALASRPRAAEASDATGAAAK
ncbi:TolC family protein [Azoarcus olearius]|uniref:Outer membrane efflux protein n=1 Tax=Azoarcus sp. (strain BH72) TaxID=418699 RepID=A1K8L6_AZOSB|nr:TolC family protein [Azoarcus olearius]CAL95171.1 putative outer membrane efflux protein [Azoarcus olearius]